MCGRVLVADGVYDTDAVSSSAEKASAEGNPDNMRLVDHLGMSETALAEQMSRQTQEIEDEVKQQQPLVGGKEPTTNLLMIYDQKKSAEFYQKSKDLAEVYPQMRRIRGDGCCFYRALLCAQLERILTDKEELQRFTTVCKGWRQRLLDLKFPDFTTIDFCEWFDELLDDMAEGKFNSESLLKALNEEGRSNYYVTFLRLITSGYLRENADTYQGFIDGDRTVVEFCQVEIEPMFKDCDHLAIIALTNAVGMSIRIEYMDRTTAPDKGWYYDFIVGNKPPQHYFLYRPGHYDVLYKK